MKTAIVIGGGWAGLSASVELADKDYRVTLLEQSGKLGGRASSFKDEKSGETIDNGQHLFMGCYSHTLRYLKKIGSYDKLKFQKNLAVDFVNRNAECFSFRCRPLPAPFHLLSGAWGLKNLSLKERLFLFKVYRSLKNSSDASVSKKTVQEWLLCLGQSEKIRREFWDLITLATLNEQPSIAAASSLAVVLKEAFFSDREKSQIAVSGVGLSDLCGPPTEKYLSERGGSVRKNQLVSKITAVGDHVRGLVLRDGSTLAADLYISALPFFVLKKILGGGQMQTEFFSKMENLESSPIFSISLWFDGPMTDKEFAGLLNTEVQWFFNKSKIFVESSSNGYVSLVISGAHRYLGMANEELLKLCLKDLEGCFPLVKSRKLLRSLIQREKNATLSPKVGSSEFRLPQKTPLKNFLLCGDWTQTGFPATIESAVFSGELAASHA